MKNVFIIASQIALIAFIASCGIKGKLAPLPKETVEKKESANATAPSEQNKEPDLSLKSGWIGAGGDTSCLSSDQNETFCWGKNDAGQAGSKFSKQAPLGPQPVATGSIKAISIALGNAFSCILNEFSLVKCWGSNDNLQIGIKDASVTNQPNPTIVSVNQTGTVLKGYVADSLGCVSLSTGVVQCWGLANNFRLGVDHTKIENIPNISGSFSGERNISTSGVPTWTPVTHFYSSIPVIHPELSKIKINKFVDSRVLLGEDKEFYCFTRDLPLQFCSREAGKEVGKVVLPEGKKLKQVTRTNDARFVMTEDNMVYVTGGSNHSGVTGISSLQNSLSGGIGWNYLPSSEFNKFQIKELPDGIQMTFQTMCAITASGGVKCLGRNYGGMLGNGTVYSDVSYGFSKVATDVVDEAGAPISNVEKLYLGYPNICALKDDSSLWCWGKNDVGLSTLGINTTLENVPYAVKIIDSGVKDVYMTTYVGCALMEDKNLKCWGRNHHGVMGMALRDFQKVPVNVPEFNGNVEAFIPGGNDTLMCVITTSGNVTCLGTTRYGISLRPWDYDTAQPRTIESHIYQKDFAFSNLFGSVKNAKKISAGNNHVCMLANDAVRCWGGNDKGQLGINSTTSSAEPVFFRNLQAKAVDVAAAGDFTCAANDRGQVFCAGDNSRSQISQPNTVKQALNPMLVNIENVVSLGGGKNHMCAINKDGQSLCWGDNSSGQLGDGSITSKMTPSRVLDLNERVQVVVGGALHTCALTATGKVYCWGDNQFGQLGTGNNKSSSKAILVQALASMKVESIAAGNNHTCVQTSEKKSFCWGSNLDNQLGNKDKKSANLPVMIQMDK